MKKDLIFSPILLVIGVLLALLKVTGMTAHIILSVVGVIALVVYTVFTKKNGKFQRLKLTWEYLMV